MSQYCSANAIRASVCNWNCPCQFLAASELAMSEQTSRVMLDALRAFRDEDPAEFVRIFGSFMREGVLPADLSDNDLEALYIQITLEYAQASRGAGDLNPLSGQQSGDLGGPQRSRLAGGIGLEACTGAHVDRPAGVATTLSELCKDRHWGTHTSNLLRGPICSAKASQD
jgi:hypothetical protein